MSKKINPFRQNVLDIVRRIPRGKVMSYGDVAKRAGKPGAARAVGAIMKTNFDPKIPCHRVIRADGTPGGYNRGAENKRNILRKEGVTI
jgi:O-6-methylguanine DNA methyltransferase